jgi:hypothetical protein
MEINFAIGWISYYIVNSITWVPKNLNDKKSLCRKNVAGQVLYNMCQNT